MENKVIKCQLCSRSEAHYHIAKYDRATGKCTDDGILVNADGKLMKKKDLSRRVSRANE